MNLFTAIATHYTDSVKQTLSYRPIDTFFDQYNRTPVYYSLAYPDRDMLLLLLSHRPNLLHADQFGLTLYDYAYHYDEEFGTKFLEILTKHSPHEFDVLEHYKRWDTALEISLFRHSLTYQTDTDSD